MTIAANDRITLLSPSVGSTQLAYDFPLSAAGNLAVLMRRDGEETRLDLGDDYSFPDGLGDAGGGTITLVAPTEAGDAFVLYGQEEIESASDFGLGLTFSAAKLNTTFDGFVRKLQEMRRDVDHTFRVPYGQDGQAGLPLLRDGHTMIWSDNAGAFVEGPEAASLAAAETILETAETAADSAAADSSTAQAAAAEAAATLASRLEKASNLSDLPDKPQARTHLGLSANGSSLVTAADYAAMRTLLGLAYNDAAAQRALLTSIGAQFQGQCRLDYDSGNLALSRFNGQFLWCNGKLCTLPAVALTLAATGLTPSTWHYIYAVETAGVITSIEPSTTAPTTHTDGTQIKTGDASRALVGGAYVNSGPAWNADVWLSLFNRKMRKVSAGASGSSPSSTLTTVTTGASFPCWSGDAVICMWDGDILNTSAGVTMETGLYIDGNVPFSVRRASIAGANYYSAVHIGWTQNGLSTGLHAAQPAGRTNGGTGTWAGTTQVLFMG